MVSWWGNPKFILILCESSGRRRFTFTVTQIVLVKAGSCVAGGPDTNTEKER